MLTFHHVASAGFEAARQLPDAADARARLHGHSFFVEASRAGDEAGSLTQLLNMTCAELTYSDLNQRLAHPDDLPLAHYLQQQLQQHGVEHAAIRLRSAPGRGADITDSGEGRIWLKVDFSAAHYLPHVPAGHQCGRMHGHTFSVKITARASEHNHAALERAWLPLSLQLHHAYLNDIAGLENPTSENLAAWLWPRLAEPLAGLISVTVHETVTAGSRFDGQQFRIWKEQRFEAAVPFDQSGRYTGDSYRVNLHLTGQLDEVMGWVEDFGDVKAQFKPIYQQLDHHPLDQLPAITRTDCAGIAAWVWLHAKPLLPMLSRVDIYAANQMGVRAIAKG